MSQLHHKKAVITGGSDGIGLGIAKAFVENGADVVIIARNEEKLGAARSQLIALSNREVHCLSADLADCSTLPETAWRIIEICPNIDILVNNAGNAIFTPFSQVTQAELDDLMNLNVKAPYFLTQNLLPALAKQRGAIINISSYFSHRMMPGRCSTAYSLTKGAVDSFTKALASEIGPKGIRVNAIAPGTVDTPLVQTVMANMTAEAVTNFQDRIATIYPLGKIGQVEDIAGAAVYLASDAAKWVTGAIFNIDGGLTTN